MTLKQSWSISSKKNVYILNRHGGYLFDFLWITIFIPLLALFFLLLNKHVSEIDIDKHDSWRAYSVTVFSLLIILLFILVIFNEKGLFLKRITILKDSEITIFKYLLGFNRKINDRPSHILLKYHQGAAHMTTNIIFQKHKHIIITLIRVSGTEEYSLKKSLELSEPILDQLNIPYKTEI